MNRMSLIYATNDYYHGKDFQYTKVGFKYP
jgi:hypothetical protein